MPGLEREREIGLDLWVVLRNNRRGGGRVSGRARSCGGVGRRWGEKVRVTTRESSSGRCWRWRWRIFECNRIGWCRG